MKKTIIICLIVILLLIGIFMHTTKRKEKKENLTKVTVAEVAHSIFYAPQYLADSLGYFKENGLKVKINLTQGADAVIASVLSNEANIGFCGTEATIYVDDKKKKSSYFIKYKITTEPTSNKKDIINIIKGKLIEPFFLLSNE